MSVAVKVDAAQALAHLSSMELHLKNPSGLMRNFGEYMKGSIDKNFSAGGRPTPWAPLKLSSKIAWHTKRSSYWNKKGSAMTKAGKSAWGGRIPLTDTAQLRRSIAYVASTNSLTIGTNVKYAAIHQFGGKIPPIYPKAKKALYWATLDHPVKRTRGAYIPARPYLLFHAEDLTYFSQAAIKFVIGT